MASVYPNFLCDQQLKYLNESPVVLSAKAKLDAKDSGTVSFSLPLNQEIKETMYTKFGFTCGTVPMRWIKGDTAPHVDAGASAFENTYLIYLSDSPGEFMVDSQSYAITANTAFVFNEGLQHETKGTNNVARLLLGPMNEFAQQVGRAPINYYPSETDALAGTNFLGYSFTYEVGQNGPFGGFTSWRIASNSTGSSSQSAVYPNGSLLDDDINFAYNLYPSNPCFLQGSTILCQVNGVETFVPVEELRAGTLVKTALDGYKAVAMVGNGKIRNPGNDERTQNRLYKCSTSEYPDLTEDLYITGCHSILEFPITDKQKYWTIKHLGKLFVTGDKYRLMACVDERAEPWNSEGTFPIWHFALESADEKMNYGVYANGGLLVETSSLYFLKNKSNMSCCFH